MMPMDCQFCLKSTVTGESKAPFVLTRTRPIHVSCVEEAKEAEREAAAEEQEILLTEAQ